jgi:hypothetical protein
VLGKLLHIIEGSCLVKNLIKEFDFNLEETFFRMKSLITSSFALTRKSLTLEREVPIEEILVLRDETWKMRNAALLLQSKESLATGFSSASRFYILERNASILRSIVKVRNQRGIKVSKQFVALFDDIESFFSVVKPIHKQRIEDVEWSIKEQKVLLERVEKFILKGKDEALLAHYLSELIVQIHNVHRIF